MTTREDQQGGESAAPSPEARPDLEQRAREKAHAMFRQAHLDGFIVPLCWQEGHVGKCGPGNGEWLSWCDRLTAFVAAAEAEREALQRERDDLKSAHFDVSATALEQTARLSAMCGERDTALADLAAARADLDSATVLYAQVSGDLAALRRRVGEAAREDDAIAEVVRRGVDLSGATIAETKHLLSVIDHARAGAGELRGMLKEAVRLLKDRPAHGYAPDSYGNLWQHEVSELTNRPDVLAAIKEEPGT